MSTAVDVKGHACLGSLLERALAELRTRGCIDTPAWLRRHPEHAAELAELLSMMVSLEAALAECLPDAGVPDLRASASPDGHDTWATQQGIAPPPKEEIGRYTLLEVLGRGGMGVVYKAYDPQLQRNVAIKVPRFEQPGLVSQESRMRFLREARAAAAIRHAHICPIYDVGEHAGTPYVVMAFVAGPSLAEWLGGRADVKEYRPGIRLVREIAAALAALHAEGIIHRDLKPANILLDGAGHALLTDFGLSRFECDAVHLTAEGTLTGTPAYMAPEQARCGKVDARSDLFSLGSVLYQVCTGELPFKGATTAQLLTALALDTPKAPRALNPDLPPKLADLLMRLLAKDPARRPRSAQEVVKCLQAIERDRAGANTSPPKAPVTKAPATKTPLPAAAIKVTGIKKLQAPARAVLKHPAQDVPVAPARSKTRETAVAARPASRAKTHPRGKWQRPATAVIVGLLVLALASVAFVGVCVSFAISTKDRNQPAADSILGEKAPGVGIPKKSGPLPLKVVLLAGQTDMAGPALTGTLDRLGNDPRSAWLLPKIKNQDGSWKVCERVWVSYQRDKGLKQGPLTVGFGESDREVGPELLFGHTLGEAFENPILLVKVTQGAMSLGVESRPPSAGGTTGAFYKRMVQTVRGVLANPKAHYPDYAEQGCEFAGFVWFQGWNDHLRGDLLVQYEANLVHLVKDVRRDLAAPDLPVVIGEFGIGGKSPTPEALVMRKAQAAAARRPELAGTVALAETASCWDEEAHGLFLKGYDRIKNQWHDDVAKKQFDPMACQSDFLYLGSGKTFALIGHRFGESMTQLWRRKRGAT